MRLKSLILLTVLLFITGNIFAQKPEPAKPTVKPADEKPAPSKLPAVSEILAKYVQAIGGREANEKIKTRTYKGTVEIPAAGLKGTVENFSSAPDKSISHINLSGIGAIVEAYDGKIGWSVNPIQGSREKSGQELAQTKLTSNFYREINLDKLYPKMEVKGLDKVGDTDVYVVVASPDGLPAETYFFDTKSGLLLRSDLTLVTADGNSPSKNFFEDYREIDGVKMPFKIRTVSPQFELVTILTEVKSNIPIDDAKFSKPK